MLMVNRLSFRKINICKNSKVALLIVLTAIICLLSVADNANCRVPAEFEKSSAIWLTWPNTDFILDKPVSPVFMELVKSISPYASIKLIARNESERLKIKAVLRQLKVSNVTVYTMKYDSIWIRDTGPIFQIGENNELMGLFYDDRKHTREGVIPLLVDEIDRKILLHLRARRKEAQIPPEAGGRSVNGKGTLLAVESVELYRNPKMIKKEIETELKSEYNVKHVVWLKRGLYEDELHISFPMTAPVGRPIVTFGTNGHLDEFCHFVDAHTILLAYVTPEEAESDSVSSENFIRLEESYKILSRAVDQDGKPFKIVRIPTAKPIQFTVAPYDNIYNAYESVFRFLGYTINEKLPLNVVPVMSYVNYVIANNIVVAPKYWEGALPYAIKKRDEEALNTLKKVFPGKIIIQVNALPINFGGGGIHCITLNEPLHKF
ncbi:MAG: agmatine deiminase family protein [Nitrospirae bacterium]|nr:agmatine deiminase family protein [Nitrospirota bacterium]